VQKLNDQLQWQIDNSDKGTRSIPIDLKTAKAYAFVDASFANNKDLSSQIGVVIVIGNEDCFNQSFTLKGNLVH